MCTASPFLNLVFWKRTWRIFILFVISSINASKFLIYLTKFELSEAINIYDIIFPVLKPPVMLTAMDQHFWNLEKHMILESYLQFGQIADHGKKVQIRKNIKFDSGWYDISTFSRSVIISVKPKLLRVNPGGWICPFFVKLHYWGLSFDTYQRCTNFIR